MRVLAEKTLSGETTTTLYFYDEGNSVLSEWKKEGVTERWDRSTLYLEGKSVFTYEWDAQAANIYSPEMVINVAPALRGPEPPALLGQQTGSATIRWGRSVGEDQYNLEIAHLVDGDLQQVASVTGLAANHYDSGLGPGDYYLRLAVTGGVKSTWAPYRIDGPEVVADLSLDGHAQDNSAYANHGTASGTLTVTGYQDQGTGLRFPNGTGQVIVDNPNGLPLGTEPRTYMGHLYLDKVSLSAPRVVFDHGPSQDQSGNRVRFQVSGNTYSLDLAGTQVSASLTNTGKGGSWVHFAVTWDGSTWRIYLNGAMKVAQAVTGFHTKLGPLYLGLPNPYGTGAGQLSGLSGSLDAITVINRALSADEVAQASAN